MLTTSPGLSSRAGLPQAWYQPRPPMTMSTCPPPLAAWWMCQLLRQPGSPLPHFITDAPSFSAPVPGRVIVPIRDAAAHTTFYLLARTDCRQEAENLFDWVSRQ